MNLADDFLRPRMLDVKRLPRSDLLTVNKERYGCGGLPSDGNPRRGYTAQDATRAVHELSTR
jgi:hypothetical protein